MRFMIPALLALAAAPAVMMSPAPAIAQTQADCEAMIASLRGATADVAISGKNADKDRTGLLAKLDAASAELAKGKNSDAALKLTDFRDKVGQLATAGRISAADATSLAAQVDSAIACVNGLSAG